MKLKYTFVIRQVAGEWTAVTVGVPEKEGCAVHLKAGGAFLMEHMKEDTTEEALAALLIERDGLSPERAADVVRRFVGWFRETGLLEE